VCTICICSAGALIYLLDLYCNATNPNIREKTAELFAKILSDKLVGPKVRIIMCKFLPPVFMDAMRDSAEASVHMFEGIDTHAIFCVVISFGIIPGCHENPELIWKDEAREKVSSVVRQMKIRHYNVQRENPDAKWNIPEDFSVVYSDVQGELTVGGVFLRLFVANPGWVLRKPKEFLVDLLEKWSELVQLSNPNVSRSFLSCFLVELCFLLQVEVLETVTGAICAFLNAQQSMLEALPQLGHIPRLFKAMTLRNNCIPGSAISIMHAASSNQVCRTLE
jgi:DnaJ family protein C protein 13